LAIKALEKIPTLLRGQVMNSNYRRIISRIAKLEDELHEELHRQKQRMDNQIENGKVVWQKKMVDAQLNLKTHVIPWLLNSKTKNLLTIPFIYPLIVPLFFLDVCVFIYQLVCFRLYGIARVNRQKYFVFDRHHLPYLNGIEKFNCFYCSYANGVIAYVREIASKTEQYWCPIKHSEKIDHPHTRYVNFVDYGQGEDYRTKEKKLRRLLRPKNLKNPP
jgi:hypothetical protein